MHSTGKIRVIWILLAVLTAVDTGMVKGQISRPGKPYPVYYQGLRDPDVYEFRVSEEKLKAIRSTDSSMLKPASSGLMIDTELGPSNSGTWGILSDGSRVWRIGLKVKDAASLNLILKPFHLNPGVKIFLYDPSRQHVLGAYSDLNNKITGILATSHIPGETIILEVQVPRYLNSAGSLVIDRIGCDFSETGKIRYLKDGWFGLSGACNLDINCFDQEDYGQIKNAVVRIVYAGEERCTGTLMNNTRQDGTAYVLTAEHCINTEDEANAAVFYFEYESPFCNGPDGNAGKSVSGATLRATGRTLDFSLLELLEPVPFIYKPFFAGWDLSSSPPASVYTIHHPVGDVKKISIENDPVSVASYGMGYDNNTHWLVSRWESGTTEVGSSGGGLFDTSCHLRGSLTGGQANCAVSINDYFQMVGHCWNDYPLSENQLACWLDPLNSNVKQMDGLDPYADFWKSGDTLSNILPDEALEFTVSGLAWGQYSGHNSLYINQFAEAFTENEHEKILGMMLHVDNNYVADSGSRMVVRIWQGGTSPGQVIYEKNVYLAELSDTLNFIEFDSVVTLGTSFFAGYELFYSNPQDTFSVMMAENREAEGRNTAYVYRDHWQSLEQFTGEIYSSFAVFPVVFDSLPEEEPPLEFQDNAMAYPNPASSIVWIEFRDMLPDPVSITLSNLQGQIFENREYGPYQRLLSLDISRLSNGLYMIAIQQGSQVTRIKLVVLK